MTKEVIVESFELDHTAVKAPYVRLIGEETGPKGDIISNFDIRLVQPNENAIPTAGAPHDRAPSCNAYSQTHRWYD